MGPLQTVQAPSALGVKDRRAVDKVLPNTKSGGSEHHSELIELVRLLARQAAREAVVAAKAPTPSRGRANPQQPMET